jgi:O-antigen/teichoic acid export membrane protein
LIAIIFGRAIQFLLSLVMMRVATTLLSPEEMGKVALVSATTAFFALFLINPVGMFINRRIHAWRLRGVAKYYLSQYAKYLVFVSLVAGLGLLTLFMTGILEFGVSFGWLIALVCGSLIFNTINQTSIPSLNLLGYSKIFLVLSVTTLAIGFIVAIFFVEEFRPNAEFWLLGILFGQAVMALVGTKILFSKLDIVSASTSLKSLHTQRIKALFHFAWPVAISAGLVWVQSQGYRYLMESQLGLVDLGLFVAGYGISAGIIAAFESILTTYFQPRLYRDVSGSSLGNYAKAWHKYAMVIIPSIIITMGLVIALAPELTKILLGSKFQLATNFVLWGALVESCRALVGVYTLIAHVYMRTRLLIIPSLIGASLSIALCALLIPIFGAIGAGIGLVISGVCTIAALHVLLIKHVEGDISKQPIFVALLFGFILWGSATLMRDFLDDSNWSETIINIVIVGFAYIAMQYFCLRNSLIEGELT